MTFNSTVIMSTANQPDALDLRVIRDIDRTYTELASQQQFRKLGWREETAVTLTDTFTAHAGFGYAQRNNSEGRPASTTDDKKFMGRIIADITECDYSIGAVITKKLLTYNLQKGLFDVTRNITHSLTATVDLASTMFFWNGFLPSGNPNFQFTGTDGVQLISASHVLADGSTYSNYLGSVPLTYSNIEKARVMLEDMPTDRNMPMISNGKYLLVASTRYQKQAEEALGSIGDPTTANRISNVYRLRGGNDIEIFIDRYYDKTRPYHWFLMDTARFKEMAWLHWGKDGLPRIDSKYDPEKQEHKYWGRESFRFVFSDPRFVVASDSFAA